MLCVDLLFFSDGARYGYIGVWTLGVGGFCCSYIRHFSYGPRLIIVRIQVDPIYYGCTYWQ